MADLLEHQYLTFSLEGERYALPVSRVREVLERSSITKLPGAADYLRGLIELRGKGVPVLDLRRRFGMAEAPEGRESAIVVVESGGEGGLSVAGLLADAVHEVLAIDPGLVEAPPRFGAGPAADFLLGIGRREEGFVLLLDLDRILSEGEAAFPSESEPEAAPVEGPGR